MNRKICSIIVMMFLVCNQVIATSHYQTIVMGGHFFDPSVVKHPPHRVPASFIYAEQDGHKIKFQQKLFGEMIKVIGNHSILYTTIISDDGSIEIPNDILGDVELQLVRGSFVYTAFIEL